MTLINRFNLEIFKSTDFHDACQVVYVLNKRGFKKVKFSDPVSKNEYKTYAKIDLVKKDIKKFFYVEYIEQTDTFP